VACAPDDAEKIILGGRSLWASDRLRRSRGV